LEDTPPPGSALTSEKVLTIKPRASGTNQSLTELLSEAVSGKDNRRVSFSLPLETPQREREGGENFYIRRNPLFKTTRQE